MRDVDQEKNLTAVADLLLGKIFQRQKE